MRNIWKRMKCWAFGHRYVSDGVRWSMCYGCGRQYKPLTSTSPDSGEGDRG